MLKYDTSLDGYVAPLREDRARRRRLRWHAQTDSPRSAPTSMAARSMTGHGVSMDRRRKAPSASVGNGNPHMTNAPELRAAY